MTDDDASADTTATDGFAAATRRARIETSHGDAATAARVAAAVEPDNTAEMATDVEGDRVVTTVARDSTGGLASTVDDYVVNCTVAAQLTTERDEDVGGTDDRAGDDPVGDSDDADTTDTPQS